MEWLGIALKPQKSVGVEAICMTNHGVIIFLYKMASCKRIVWRIGLI